MKQFGPFHRSIFSIPRIVYPHVSYTPQHFQSPTMAVINIKIKSSGDKKYDVEVDTEATIEDLKVIISAVADVPPENQRLIYSGKVLKDPETVAFYKIQNDHSVHLVKSQGTKLSTLASSASNTNSAPSTRNMGTNTQGNASNHDLSTTNAIPSNLAAGQGSFNPLADLTGARYAGYAQLPSESMFGPDGGMGAFQDPEQLETLLLSPQFIQEMSALALNPQMMDMLMRQNPQLRDMSPEARQMLQPMFREMMTNPESLRSILALNLSLGAAGGAGGAGPFGGFPAPGNPLGAADLDAAAASTSGTNGASALPAFPGFGDQGAAGGSANPFANFWNPVSAPAAAPDNRPPEERYEDQLRQLNEMGFSDFDMNVAALRRSGGHVQGAIDYLLSLSNF